VQTITVTHSPLGKKLKKPITFAAPEIKNIADEKLQEYIITSLSWKLRKLIPFTFGNASTIELAKHLLRHRTGSKATLYQYMYGVYRFCKWANTQPDQLIKSCQDIDGDPKPKALAQISRLLDDFIGCLQAEGLAPGSVSNHVKSVKALFRVNRLKIDLPYTLSKRVVYSDRAPNPEELQYLLDISNLRNRLIISMLALGGFRIGTLVKLQYRHVRRDIEKGITPIHIHIEAEITKGKYHDYDTFLSQEVAEYLRAYLDLRRQGTKDIPPENIHDGSPLIRNQQSKRVLPISTAGVHQLVHKMYVKANMITKNPLGRRYDIRAHSLRKYFRTQMAALGVDRDYIEYMMGHTISTYHDIKMKGIEFLRGVYAASGLSIKPKTRVSKIDALKEIIRAWGLNPEEILTKNALTQPHRTVINREQVEQNQIHQLSIALKNHLLTEMREK